MLSATAKVVIMVGADALGGVRGSPSQPASPIAVVTDTRTMMTVANIPQNDRKKRSAVIKMTRYIRGVSVDRSCTAASKNEFESMTLPVK